MYSKANASEFSENFDDMIHCYYMYIDRYSTDITTLNFVSRHQPFGDDASEIEEKEDSLYE